MGTKNLQHALLVFSGRLISLPSLLSDESDSQRGRSYAYSSYDWLPSSLRLHPPYSINARKLRISRGFVDLIRAIMEPGAGKMRGVPQSIDRSTDKEGLCSKSTKST